MEKKNLCYNAAMNQNEKIKRIVLIFLGALASGYFMYSGFSLLFVEEDTNTTQTQAITHLSE